jgi:Holliday junction resolvase RusA-like endonuclease
LKESVTFTVPGKIPSKKNSSKIMQNRKTGARWIGYADEVERYESKVRLLATKASLENAGLKLTGPLKIEVMVYTHSETQDTDNMLGAIFDGLKRSRLIQDDVQFRRTEIEHFETSDKEYIEVTISQLDRGCRLPTKPHGAKKDLTNI